MFSLFRNAKSGVIWVAVAVMLVSATAADAQTRQLHLASTPWSPFTNVPGKARYALDLVHAALERLQITAETSIIEESKLTSALIAGEFQGSAALWRDEARERALIYSQPYLENRLVLVARKGTNVSAKTLSEIKGKRLALVGGYAYGDSVRGPNAPVQVLTSGEEDSLQKLLDGTADYTLMDELVVDYLIRNFPKEVQSRLALGSTPLIVRTLHLAISRNIPDAQTIIDRFNTELKKMVADRSYNRLLHLDWILADVDGDGIAEYVPSNDQVGSTAPDHSYKLFVDRAAPDYRKPQFYLGGKVYPSWSSVPDGYKANKAPGTFSEGSQFTIFTFKF